MATAKMGAMVTDIKGKIGGTVFQGSKTGTTIKNKQSRTGIGSGNKLTKADAGRLFNGQSAVTVLSSAWRDLSDAERNTWITAAPSFPFINRYGDSYIGSGYQLYMSCNLRLISAGLATITEAPIPAPIENCPAIVPSFDISSGVSIACAAGIPAGYVMELYASVGISAGRNPTKGTYKMIAQLPASTVFPFAGTANYTRVFGNLILGSTVWVMGKLTKADAGFHGTTFQAKTAVVA